MMKKPEKRSARKRELPDYTPEELEAAIPYALLREVAETGLGMFSYTAKKYGPLIKKRLEDGTISENELEEALKNHADAQGHERWKMSVNGPAKPDPVLSDYLAYALSENGVLTEEEKIQTPFDHGENVVTFCEKYRRPDFIGYLKTKLLNPE